MSFSNVIWMRPRDGSEFMRVKRSKLDYFRSIGWVTTSEHLQQKMRELEGAQRLFNAAVEYVRSLEE